MLASIGRVCMPTSKRVWSNWAKTTTLAYLLRCSLSKIDSQHFWNLMDALSIEAIPKTEKKLLEKIIKIYDVESDNFFHDYPDPRFSVMGQRGGIHHGKNSPKSLPGFQRVFPNEEACYAYLYAALFPNGFMCPYCNWSGNACRFQNRPDILRCMGCKRDTRLICRYHNAEKQGSTPYLVLGCFTCYISNAR